MSQATSDLHRKRQRSSTPSRSNRAHDIDQLQPDVEELIVHAYNNSNDIDERDSDSNDDNDDETEDEEEAEGNVGNRREPVGEETGDEMVRHTPQLRATTFNGFKDPAHELLLLKALDTVRPFGIQHGKTGAAWSRVVQYLRDYDDKERADGRPTVFDDVNPRVSSVRV
ncbi:MAG: hypothetical protein J3R72DRAFT_480791 [Linnemannia gamsii]|nr:MAG: hypothetical protein J3R72DRAFT_480791 [Linnemannia gamsii]